MKKQIEIYYEFIPLLMIFIKQTLPLHNTTVKPAKFYYYLQIFATYSIISQEMSLF